MAEPTYDSLWDIPRRLREIGWNVAAACMSDAIRRADGAEKTVEAVRLAVQPQQDRGDD